MSTVQELLSAYETAETLTEAERALDSLGGLEVRDDLSLGDLYDQLAELAAEAGEFTLAVRAQRRAIELGCDHLELARQMLAWYLLKDGQRAAGEAAFSELRATDGDDIELVLTLGAARADSGDEGGALEAFDEALAMATSAGDERLIARARAERRESRAELGLEPDEEDRRAPRVPVNGGEQVRWSVAWFPRDQTAAAVRRWPSLASDLTDPDAYCRSRPSLMSSPPQQAGDRRSHRLACSRCAHSPSPKASIPTAVKRAAASQPSSTGVATRSRGRPAATTLAGAARDASTSGAAQRGDPRGRYASSAVLELIGGDHGGEG